MHARQSLFTVAESSLPIFNVLLYIVIILFLVVWIVENLGVALSYKWRNEARAQVQAILADTAVLRGQLREIEQKMREPARDAEWKKGELERHATHVHEGFEAKMYGIYNGVMEMVDRDMMERIQAMRRQAREIAGEAHANGGRLMVAQHRRVAPPGD
ncbi:hypothetical protein H0H81_000232 [Sphagnurus paluster]|uniref:Uncharacterized protein n=1 Tax=Sphagnurus paluster TaxID=117069 RepID=A0A9P7GRX3_9AGAR|nr:hypothetical protein H0H81_000232 [Sphagnurus paluster]